MTQIKHIITLYPVALVFSYLGLAAFGLFFYLMGWFVEQRQPNINIFEWSEGERLLLFLYLFMAAPIVAFHIYCYLKKKADK